MPDQTTLLLTLLTFAVGTIAGFQGIVARIPGEWEMALKTFYGVSYIVTRGTIPAALYLALHQTGWLHMNQYLEALVLGGGSETFLRSRILIGFKQGAIGQAPTEETKGPLDLIFSLQRFFVDRAANVLAAQRMKAVDRFYDKPNLKLEDLVAEVRNNAGALGDQEKDAIDAADNCLQDYLKEKAKYPAGFDPKKEQGMCRRLGFALYNALSFDNYVALSARITK